MVTARTPQEQLVLDFFRTLSTGELEAIRATLHPQATWRPMVEGVPTSVLPEKIPIASAPDAGVCVNTGLPPESRADAASAATSPPPHAVRRCRLVSGRS